MPKEQAPDPPWLEQRVGELVALTTDAERRRYLAGRPELRSTEIVEKLCGQVARLVGGVDVGEAESLAETLRFLVDELDDDLGRAFSARAAANVLHSSGESERAQALYQLALERFLAHGDEEEAAFTQSCALLNLAYLGEYDLVHEWEAEARRVLERHGNRLRLAILDHNYANILYRQDRWPEALQRYERAYREFLELGRSQEVAYCLRNIAVCHISLHNFSEALRVYRSGRAYCEEQGLPLLVLEADYNIAYLFYLRGEYTRAIQLFEAARRQSEAEGDEYHKALCDLDSAEIYLELNLVEKAESLAHAAYASFEELRMPYETAKALTNSAIALSRQGRGGLALDLLLRAREIFVREKNQLWTALIDFYRAVVLYRERQSAAALEMARVAREALSASALTPRAVMCELLLAEVLLDLDEPDRARETCRDALQRLAELDLPALEYKTYLVLGEVEEAAGNFPGALNAYRQSFEWLEQLRSQLQGEDLKIAFLEDKQVVYESLVWLTMAGRESGPREETAFGYIEKAKSRSLADLMSFRAYALPSKSREEDVAEKVRALREELNWLYRQVDRHQLSGGERALEEAARLRNRTRDKEHELLHLLRELRSTDQELSSMQSGTVADLDTLRSSLPEGSVLVEYFIARETVFVCVVDRKTLEIRRLTTAAQARNLYRLLQFQLARMGSPAQHVAALAPLIEEATRSHLCELYGELIEPIRPRLDRSEVRHLIVVPHGFLHYVPFHALHDGEACLIDRFSLSYAPSAGVFHLCATKTSRYEDRSLVLGVADERAPLILEEARAVARALPDATLLLGQEASVEALQQHGAGSRFVHIATHGLFRRDNPMFSAIQLGTSRLSLFDLYELQLDAELVVLSGCGTGLHAVLGADELLGLTRGLLYAGARSVLVTLWDVNDASTASFMATFYRHLGSGCGVASALRRTMLEIRETWPDPYHWAPFVLVGKPG